MCLCKCEGSHYVEEIGSWDGCPLEGFAHTAFILNRCKECGNISGFPSSNLQLALEKGTPETKKKLAEIINENEQGASSRPSRNDGLRCGICGEDHFEFECPKK